MQISQRCEQQELAAFRRYQSSMSNTWSFVAALLDADVPLFRASVTGKAAIGELQTFFKNVGTATAHSRHGALRFSVAQLVQLLEDANLVAADPQVSEMRGTVHQYADLFQSPASAPQVTVLAAADISILLDGNKTTAAGYLHSSRSGQESFVLPVYCLYAPRQRIGHLFV